MAKQIQTVSLRANKEVQEKLVYIEKTLDCSTSEAMRWCINLQYHKDVCKGHLFSKSNYCKNCGFDLRFFKIGNKEGRF